MIAPLKAVLIPKPQHSLEPGMNLMRYFPLPHVGERQNVSSLFFHNRIHTRGQNCN